MKLWRFILFNLLVILFLHFCARAAFVIYNLELFIEINLSEILKALFYGLKFDLATVLILNIFWVLGIIVFFQSKKIWEVLFYFINTLALIFMWVDIELFHFMGKKLTIDFFTLGSDIGQQLPQLIKYYWWVPLITFLNFFFIFKIYRKNISKVEVVKSGYKWIPIILVVSFILVRGGFQMRSLSPKDAFIFDNYDVGNIALNSIYSLTRTIGDEEIIKISYFKNEEANKILLESGEYELKNEIKKNQNIVFIIVESLSSEYLEKYTPFLNEFAEKALFFPMNVANGRRSMEALPSLFAGIPALMKTPLHKSKFQNNKFITLPQILKENGYHLSFFHGGKRGTMGFDSYCRSLGIKNYFALEDYPYKNDFDGTWGIFDHAYLNYFAENLNKFREPFFSTVFTLTSHQPYKIPSQFEGKFPEGNLEIHESIGYVDYSLKLFFEKIKNEPWYQNTLFVITADHSQKLESAEFNTLWGRYRVPLIFFHPSINLKKFSDKKITQHADVSPTVLDFLGIKNAKTNLFGQSLFGKGQGRAINFISGFDILFKENFVLLKKDDQVELFELDKDLKNGKKINDDTQKNILEREIKAFRQYYNNSLLKNDLYIKL
jgi:phosphoglycerol transferase MdoB-like AlkP superfamily enzyme